MPETTNRAYTYPASTGHTRLWEHYQTLADDIDADVEIVATAVEDKATAVVKASDETVTSSTTMQDDNELFVTLPVGLWRVEAMLIFTGATGGDFKCTWSFAGTAAGSQGRMMLGPATATTSAVDTSMRAANTTSGGTAIYGVDGTFASAAREDLIWNVTASGVLTLQWAQQASSGTATTLLAGSRLYITKLG